jgi:hypothetical protein
VSTSSDGILVTPPKWQYAIPRELIEDLMLKSATLKQFQDTFKDLYKFSTVSVLVWRWLPLSAILILSNYFPYVGQELANHSRKKSDKVRAIKYRFHQLQEKDHEIGEQIYKKIKFRNQLSHPIYKDINRAIIYAPGSSHTYIQQNYQDITTHITK